MTRREILLALKADKELIALLADDVVMQCEEDPEADAADAGMFAVNWFLENDYAK